MRIQYAQCWEDPRTLERALRISPEDDVVSIASAGDNTLALLLNKPSSLVAVDLNPAQLALVELKMRAIERLDHDQFVRFVGARESQERDRLYRTVRPALSERAKAYWDQNPDALRRGIIHCGRFENYFRIFRRAVLPLIHGRPTVRSLLELSSLEDQGRFYEQVWNNRRWLRLFRVFFGRFLLGHLGRDPSYFRYVTLDKVAEVLLARARHGLTEIPIPDNYFIEYIFTGRYGRPDRSHPYLQPSNFQVIKENIGRLRLVHMDFEAYLKTLPARSVSKFNLSDIFEYMSEAQVESALREIRRVSRPRARLAFWTLFIPRRVPPSLTDQIAPCSSESIKLHFQARTFFYGSFCLWTVQDSPRPINLS